MEVTEGGKKKQVKRCRAGLIQIKGSRWPISKQGAVKLWDFKSNPAMQRPCLHNNTMDHDIALSHR